MSGCFFRVGGGGVGSGEGLESEGRGKGEVALGKGAGKGGRCGSLARTADTWIYSDRADPDHHEHGGVLALR